MRRFTMAVMAAALLFTSGCGTLFFSHRIGKEASKVIDKRVFYTNCFLCLFAIIPGVVAFVLDYDNGTIYYTEAELLPDDLVGMKERGELKKITLADLNIENAAAALSKKLGKEVTPEMIRVSLRESNKAAHLL